MNRGDTAVVIVCGAALLLASTFAAAQSLPDPTRPPPGLDQAEGAAAPGPAAIPAPQGLRTIIRRQGARPAAIVNGEYVELGGTVGDAKVVKIGEDFVILRSGTTEEILRLMPGVEKKAAIPETRRAAPRKPRHADGTEVKK